MTLKKNLTNLIKTSRKLLQWSKTHGSAEHYFTSLTYRFNNDAKQVALCFGLPGSDYKLPALGVPLAAETLKNIGFDLAKPDRHIVRAAGSFGLVRFSNWKDREGTKPPRATTSELLDTMCPVEKFACALGKYTTFLDNAIWLAMLTLYVDKIPNYLDWRQLLDRFHDAVTQRQFSLHGLRNHYANV